MNYCQLHESLSPWPASTHSKLPLHWALHLIVILTFQVNFIVKMVMMMKENDVEEDSLHSISL